MSEFTQEDFPEDSTVAKIARVSNLTGEEIASRLRKVKTVGRFVWRGYQVIATLLIVSLIGGYFALFTQEYRDKLLPYKSNVYTKSCRAKTEGGVVIEGTRTVYDRYQSFGPLSWKSETESSETTKVTLRVGEALTVIGLNGTDVAFTKVFAAADRGDQSIKPAQNLVFVLGAKPDVASIPYQEFCK
jgi:hypothetical protein